MRIVLSARGLFLAWFAFCAEHLHQSVTLGETGKVFGLKLISNVCVYKAAILMCTTTGSFVSVILSALSTFYGTLLANVYRCLALIIVI